VLDLRHHTLVRLVREVGVLGDQPVEPGALEAVEPGAGDRLVAGDRREMDRRRRVRERLLERGAAVREGLAGEIVVAQREQVEGDEAGRGLTGQARHAARGRMDALLERPEVQAARAGDDDLAVDHCARREVAPDRLHQLGEVPGHRPLVAAADLDLLPVAKHDRAEAVPFGLVELAARDRGHGLGQHRRNGRHHGELDRPMLARRFAGAIPQPSHPCGWCRSNPGREAPRRRVCAGRAPHCHATRL
jgi:hypothetical protein